MPRRTGERWTTEPGWPMRRADGDASALVNRLRRFLLWMFPFWLTDQRQCVWCGDVWEKSRMYYRPPYGWYCSENEADEDWAGRQW